METRERWVTAHGNSAETDRPSSSPWSRRNPLGAALAYAACYLLVAFVGAGVVAAVDSPLAQVVLVTLVAGATLGLSLLLALSLCRIPMGPWRELGWAVAMMGAFCITRPLVFAILGRLVGVPERGEALQQTLTRLPWQFVLGNVALITWAVLLGRLISRLIREGKLLLPVAVVASAVDTFTVFRGVVKEVSEKAPEVVEAFSAQAPVAAPPEVVAPILSVVGIGDFLFFALFLALALRYSMNAPKTMWATFGVMLVAPAAFFVWPEAPGIPGLPFISAAVLAVNWRYLHFTGEEKRALAFGGALVAAVAAGLWVILHR